MLNTSEIFATIDMIKEHHHHGHIALGMRGQRRGGEDL